MTGTSVPPGFHTGPMYLVPSLLRRAKELQRRGFTMTEIAYELRVERPVIVTNLYWRTAAPEVVLK